MRTPALLLLAACTSGAGPSVDADTADGLSDLSPAERVSRLVRSDEATRLVVRVHVPDRTQVPGDPWSRLAQMLEEVTDKPDGVVVDVQTAALPTQDWTWPSLQQAFDDLDVAAPEGTATIDVVAVLGDYLDEDGSVLGLGWGGQRIALFIDPLTTACTAATTGGGSGSGHTRICEASWAGILRHEAGHVLGLVNREVPMVVPHEDPDHPHHDPDPDCLMYWEWDRAELSGRVADEDLELCAGSLADLAALRDAPAP